MEMALHIVHMQMQASTIECTWPSMSNLWRSKV